MSFISKLLALITGKDDQSSNPSPQIESLTASSVRAESVTPVATVDNGGLSSKLGSDPAGEQNQQVERKRSRLGTILHKGKPRLSSKKRRR